MRGDRRSVRSRFEDFAGSGSESFTGVARVVADNAQDEGWATPRGDCGRETAIVVLELRHRRAGAARVGVVCLASRNTGATCESWRVGDGERIGGTAAADRSR